MGSKRVLISSTDFILGAAVLQELSGECDLEIIGIPEKEICRIEVEVDRVHPDVLILVDLLHCDNPKKVQEIIAKHKGLEVITLSSGDDELHIHRERSLILSKLTELPQVIRA